MGAVARVSQTIGDVQHMVRILVGDNGVLRGRLFHSLRLLSCEGSLATACTKSHEMRSALARFSAVTSTLVDPDTGAALGLSRIMCALAWYRKFMPTPSNV